MAKGVKRTAGVAGTDVADAVRRMRVSATAIGDPKLRDFATSAATVIGTILDRVDRAAMTSEDLADVAAYDRSVAEVESGGELVPDRVVERLAAGTNPIVVWRTYRGLTQARLAEQAGVTPHLLSNVENGHRDPRFSTMLKIAHALDVSVDELEPWGASRT